MDDQFQNIDALAFCVSAFWPSFSIPGSDMAIFLNRLFTLCPALADVSMNMILRPWAFAVASSSVTCLRHLSTYSSEKSLRCTHRLSDRSALFPTSTTMTSFPRSDRTSSIHFVVERKDCRSEDVLVLRGNVMSGNHGLVISNTTIATVESRM